MRYREIPEGTNNSFGMMELEPLPLTRAQQMALLTLRHSDHGAQMLKVLYAKGHSKPTFADYAALVPHGLAVRDRSGYHGITPMGTFRARIMAREIAAELGVMLVDYSRLTRRGTTRLYGFSDYGNG